MLCGPTGVIEPLCNSCISKDCTNPIQKQKISIMGIKKEHRILIRGYEYVAVIQCEGYLA